ncbi:MAG: ATP-binding protein [Magnetococcus sp. DMHC-8]
MHHPPPTVSRDSTILLVDDQPEMANLVVAFLKSQYQVKVAINGELALHIAALGGIDLILLDVVMPGLNGHEVCRRLKADPATRDIPVIFLTAQSETDDEAAGFALGAVDYIHKPPHPHLLRARVGNQLELKRHRNHLETLVDERTSALEQAKRQLESANQAKTDFLAVISHEMRTPLNSVIGFATVLSADPLLTSEQQTFARLIHDAGRHLLSNINDIIDFVRLDPTTFALEEMPFHLAHPIQEVVAVLRKEAEQKGLTLLFTYQASMPCEVVGDPRRLGQVLRHLLGNGIKFTDRGGVTLTVSATPLSTPDRARFRFAIQDTGCGIPTDKLPLLFQQFTQLEAPKTRKHDGFGLGLAMCHKLVQLMSGALQVVRSDPSGTEIAFTVDLPLAPAGEPGCN